MVKREGMRAAALKATAAAVAVTALAGCEIVAESVDPSAAWRAMDPQRIVVVGGVEFDVNLRYFTGVERTLMVHRTDQQPMFNLEFEADTAREAVELSYGRDVCGGAPLEVIALRWETPGVWELDGLCPGGVRPTVAASSVEPAPSTQSGGVFSRLF